MAEIQEQIVMAHKTRNHKLVYQLQRQLLVSFAARAIAVRRVVTNSGSKTPGVDKVLWNTPLERMKAVAFLRDITHAPKECQAQPLKRVWIPKERSTELRPLGIPTLIDRAAQAVYQMAIDPIVEFESDPNSYGFRVYRSGQDAITRLRTLLDKKNSPEWILEADVAKCFDRISHKFLLEKTPIYDKSALEQ